MITQTAKYAIKTLAYMAQLDPDVFVHARELGARLNIPANYLGKTLQRLARAHIVESQKGLHGGFRCQRKASEVTLYELLSVIDAIPGSAASACDAGLPAGFHDRFSAVQTAYVKFLRETTIADLIDGAGTCITQAPLTEPAVQPEQLVEALMGT